MLFVFCCASSLPISWVGPAVNRDMPVQGVYFLNPICTCYIVMACTLDSEPLDMPFSALFSRNVPTLLHQSSEKLHAHQLTLERAPMKYAGYKAYPSATLGMT